MTQLLIRLFVKNQNDVGNVAVRERYGTLSGVVGMIGNLILCSIKIAVGLIIGSISVLADGLNNLADMGSGIITTVGFKMAARPADKDHPFGHGRMEYLSAFIVSVLILLVGFELFKSSVEAIVNGEAAPQYSYITYGILVVSVIIKLWLFVFNKRLSKIIDSDALAATAQDSVNDSIATIVILVAAVASSVFAPPFNLDAVMGIGVSLFILYTGFNSAKETVDKLLGQPPSKELISSLEENIFAFNCFLGIHDLIVHNYGPGRCLASVHVEVPQNIDVVYCHEQIDLCEKLICERLGVELTIHCDPVDTDSEEVSLTKAKIAEAVKEIHPDATIHDFRMTPMAETRTNLIFDAVLPNGADMTVEDFKAEITKRALLINPTFVCVISVDRDYTGK
ncbi:MAG: cation transporter [Clostridia bacterium]|nr:cation transporter [Clostridia bacterium]